jgi:Tfp pilus assembly protein PilF
MPDTDLKHLQKEWEDSPRSEVFYPLACAYFDLGLHDAAADVLQQGLRHHPSHAKGLTLLGQIQYKRGDTDEARDIFNTALKSDPACTDPLCGLVEIEIAAGNCARAETWLKRAESLGETFWCKKLRQKLERKRATSPAGESELPFVTETMVDLYLKQGMNEKAVAALKQLVVQKPDDCSLRQRLDELLSFTAMPTEKQAHSTLDVESRLNAWLRAVENRKQRR